MRDESCILGPDGAPVRKDPEAITKALNQRFLHGSTLGGANVPRLPNYYKDLNKLLDKAGWAALSSNAASVISNHGGMRQLVELRASLATIGSLVPKWLGQSKDNGKIFKKYLRRWFKNCERRGAGYDWHTFWWLVLVCVAKFGDCGILYYKDRQGRPKMQLVPPFRIGHRGGSTKTTLSSGIFIGMESENGVVRNEDGEIVGYCLLGDTPEKDRQVTRSEFSHIFDPAFLDQSRGLPLIYSDVESGRSLIHAQRLEMHAALVLSSIVLVHQNQTGLSDPDVENDIDDTPPSENEDGNEQPTKSQHDVDIEEYWGGLVKYIRSNESLKVMDHRRPGADWESLQDRAFACVCAGADWDSEYVFARKPITGPRARMIEGKVNRSVKDAFSVIEDEALRAIVFALSVGIENGELPPDPDFMEWESSRPAEITIDAGRTFAEELEKWRAGFTAMQDVLDKWGAGEHEDLVRRKVREFLTVIRVIKEEEIAEGVPAGTVPTEAIVQHTANLQIPSDPADKEPDGDENEEDKDK